MGDFQTGACLRVYGLQESHPRSLVFLVVLWRLK